MISSISCRRFPMPNEICWLTVFLKRISHASFPWNTWKICPVCVNFSHTPSGCVDGPRHHHGKLFRVPRETRTTITLLCPTIKKKNPTLLWDIKWHVASRYHMNLWICFGNFSPRSFVHIVPFNSLTSYCVCGATSPQPSVLHIWSVFIDPFFWSSQSCHSLSATTPYSGPLSLNPQWMMRCFVWRRRQGVFCLARQCLTKKIPAREIFRHWWISHLRQRRCTSITVHHASINIVAMATNALQLLKFSIIVTHLGKHREAIMFPFMPVLGLTREGASVGAPFRVIPSNLHRTVLSTGNHTLPSSRWFRGTTLICPPAAHCWSVHLSFVIFFYNHQTYVNHDQLYHFRKVLQGQPKHRLEKSGKTHLVDLLHFRLPISHLAPVCSGRSPSVSIMSISPIILLLTAPLVPLARLPITGIPIVTPTCHGCNKHKALKPSAESHQDAESDGVRLMEVHLNRTDSNSRSLGCSTSSLSFKVTSKCAEQRGYSILSFTQINHLLLVPCVHSPVIHKKNHIDHFLNPPILPSEPQPLHAELFTCHRLVTITKFLVSRPPQKPLDAFHLLLSATPAS